MEGGWWCNNGGKMRRAYFSYLISRWPEGNSSVFRGMTRKTAFLELLVWMVTYAYRLEACGGNDNDTGGCVDTPPLPANRSEKRPNFGTNKLNLLVPYSTNSELERLASWGGEGCWARECAKLLKIIPRNYFDRGKEYEKFLFFSFFFLQIFLSLKISCIIFIDN